MGAPIAWRRARCWSLGRVVLASCRSAESIRVRWMRASWVVDLPLRGGPGLGTLGHVGGVLLAYWVSPSTEVSMPRVEWRRRSLRMSTEASEGSGRLRWRSACSRTPRRTTRGSKRSSNGTCACGRCSKLPSRRCTRSRSACWQGPLTMHSRLGWGPWQRRRPNVRTST